VLAKTLGVPLFQEQVMKIAVVAADYTPGEADQLRRDMAAWRRSGRIEKHRGKLIANMEKKGIPTEFAERVFQQIRGFGDYGFPESHAASFALISYAAAYLRFHYPPEFTCALLNAQPMGFYSVATIVEDAKRHGVEMRAVDVQRSEWDCVLEAGERAPAVRMGLRFVKGLSEEDGKRIVAIRAGGAFASYEDFARRLALEEKALSALAAAGAFGGIGLERRSALWDAPRLAVEAKSPLPLEVSEETPAFAQLDAFETVTWDYRATSHSVNGHLLEPLRAEIAAQGLPTAAQVAKLRNGAFAHYAGIVICRQRPGTASGVTFMTLEDETGFVNVVLWTRVFDAFPVLAKTASLLGVSGKIQKEDKVVHLVADELWTPRLRVKPETPRSRDFH
jgi:error-prone DNA polymerase